MAQSREEWQKMTPVQRAEQTRDHLAAALAKVATGEFPDGIKFTIAGRNHIARPVRVTDSGGVTYSIPTGNVPVGKYPGRWNKFSLTLMGHGKADDTVYTDDNLLE